jgi:hypothetical protein
MNKALKITAAVTLLLSIVAMPVLAQSPNNDRRAEDREAIREQARERAEERRTSAQERKQEIMADVEERRAQIKQDVCERRQERLESTLPRLATSATRVQGVIDTMYERVAGFYEDGQLTVDNYDELIDDIEKARVEAETATTAVNEFELELDCENQNVGEQLDGFRTAVREARDGLKDYRTALVSLISSLRAEATETSSEDSAEEVEESENETETENETEDEEETETETETEENDA